MTNKSIDNSRDARQHLVDCLRAYMIGPLVSETETIPAGVWATSDDVDKPIVKINQRPYDFYHVGILHPIGASIDPEEDDVDQDTSDRDNAAPEGIMALANAMKQSAFGFTSRVSSSQTRIQVDATWGEYNAELKKVNPENDTLDQPERSGGNLPLALPEPELDKEPEDSNEPSRPSKKKWNPVHWVRTPKCWSGAVLLDDLNGDLEHEVIANVDGVEIIAMRQAVDGGQNLTITMVNRKQNQRVLTTDDSVYQPQITLSTDDPKISFLPIAEGKSKGSEEFWGQELLYRELKQFATGHGCSAEWEDEPSGIECRRLWTSWIPEQEVFKASSEVLQLEDKEILNLSCLDETVTSNQEITTERLMTIPKAYEKWIDERQIELNGIVAKESGKRAAELEKAGDENLSTCRIQANRIKTGIEYLRNNEQAWKAFTLANSAMRLAMEKERQGSIARWYPFQLAFVLLAIPSTADPEHIERSTLDLIWFPTGGGKTEAYLGLSAWVMFYRRLAYGVEGAGTAILTRYTLRFLTSQQFERTSRVVMACELVRRKNPTLGDERFDIGLYVGGGVTPNWLRQAESDLTSAKTDNQSSGRTTLPVNECPWCTTELSVVDQNVRNGRLVTKCPNSECEFSAGIPVVVVDEEIFSYPPTFIVATIDKFATMPWRPEVGAIFGVGNSFLAPSLIIQDELHLISDSLGSLAGLYESAIDIICANVSSMPKIVGSTATIRRASEQARCLFNRDLLQFPSSGISVRDSFFFVEDRDQPGRKYVGIHAQGRSPKHTQPLILGNILQFSQEIEDESLRDPFHTLIVYFNSLRELGGAFVLVEDDVVRYLRALQKTGALPNSSPIRRIKPPLEISGSVSSDNIKIYTRHLRTALTDASLDREPEDIALATNMISVGVDVSRLGVMVIVGQPKTTSEYIQASSRIGRKQGTAGLVVTLYNWSRPRDRSHYENFCGYHKAFYRHVEAQSVTPFSARARDRALHSAVFSLARILVPELADEGSPSNILNVNVKNALLLLIDEVMKRITEVERDPDDVLEAEKELKKLVDEWCIEAREREHDQQRPLIWTGRKSVNGQKPLPLARRMIGSDSEESIWNIQFSMRDVDAATPVVLYK